MHFLNRSNRLHHTPLYVAYTWLLLSGLLQIGIDVVLLAGTTWFALSMLFLESAATDDAGSVRGALACDGFYLLKLSTNPPFRSMENHETRK